MCMYWADLYSRHEVGALYVFDENYWKRRCVEQLGWQECQIAEHGLTWKQLFFEVHLGSSMKVFVGKVAIEEDERRT